MLIKRHGQTIRIKGEINAMLVGIVSPVGSGVSINSPSHHALTVTGCEIYRNNARLAVIRFHNSIHDDR
jgi:hypothetical protein